MRLTSKILANRLLLALSGGLFCVLLGWFNLISPLENVVYDATNELIPLEPAPDILIVAIDDRSLTELGRWPWPREKHVELLRQLRAAGAKLIAIDILFPEPNSEHPQVDELLGTEISQHGAVILPVFISQPDRGGHLLEMQPTEPLTAAAAGLGHIHIRLDNDGVARSVFLKEGLITPNWEHLTVTAARVLGLNVDPLPGLSDGYSKQPSSATFIARSHQNLLHFVGVAGTMEKVSYVDVMKGRTPRATLRDKIVFVGSTAAGHADNVSTSLGKISGVEVNANIFHALRQGKLSQLLSREATALISFVLTFSTILVFTRLQPRTLLAAIVISSLVVPITGGLFLLYRQIWYSPAPFVLTLFLAYPLWNWLRLDTAVNFMRAQVKLLETENRKSSFGVGWSNLDRSAHFLQALGHLQEWSVDKNSPTVSEKWPARDWVHEGNLSSKWFVRGAENRKLLLSWLPGQKPATVKLNLLFPEMETLGAAAAVGGDSIDIDIGQLDFAYRQARHNRDLVENTLAQLSNGILLADFSGTIILINEQASHLLALHPDNRNLLEAMQRLAFSAEIDSNDMLGALILNGVAFNEECKTLDGGRDLLGSGRLVNLERPMALISLTDVTDLKATEKSRAEALDFLSHDLRAPLTSVLALIEGAKNENPDRLNLELLENIKGYVQNNLTYAENFTQLARLQQSEVVHCDECEGLSLIDNAVSLIFHAAKKRGIKFRISSCEEHVWINCNRSILERAILNMLDNALKHSKDNSNIDITLDRDATYAFISVADKGSGIEPGDTAVIFDSFQQGASSSAGVGLGLRFVSAAAHSHHGRITVDSKLGVGSTFTLHIPRISAANPT